MSQGVSRQPLAAEARFRSQAGPFEIRGGQRDTVTVFFYQYFGFPPSV
jgi:hypothetical protein